MSTSDDITLEIGTPKGPFKGVFPKTATVSAVVDAVAAAVDLNRTDSLELVHKGEVLPVKDTLAELGFNGTVQLELVATGSGV